MIYDTSRPPVLIHSTEPPPDSDFPQNYPRIAKWYGLTSTTHIANTLNIDSLTRNADGSAVLVQCENRTFQRLDL